MKLLYVWIEKFRNIQQQGFVVDEEYLVSVDHPDSNKDVYVDLNGNHVILGGPNRCAGYNKSLYYPLYTCKISLKRNPHYKIGAVGTICSITALVGENASGKTSILECIRGKEGDTHGFDPKGRYFFEVFLDESADKLVIHSTGLDLKFDAPGTPVHTRQIGYDEYIIPLYQGTSLACKPVSRDKALFFSVHNTFKSQKLWQYDSAGIPVIPINLEQKDVRNSFKGMFEFLCEFPHLGGNENKLVFTLQAEQHTENYSYFEKENFSSGYYKNYFIHKLANILFHKLEDYLYNPHRDILLTGEVAKIPEEDQLKKEAKQLSNRLSYCNLEYPREGIDSLITTQISPIRLSDIASTISFFHTATNIHMGQSIFQSYLDALDKLFAELQSLPAEQFTALYKLEIPFNKKWWEIVSLMSRCIENDDLDQGWFSGVEVSIEWLSAGEQQIALMFSSLYQRIATVDRSVDNLILLLDEPEMHMHPEAGRRFLEYLGNALATFQTKGFIRYCQIILSTHSPFLVQELSKYPNTISLVKKEKNRITIKNFEDLRYLMLPHRNTYSFNLVMYYIFGVPTIELHNELYGELWKANNIPNEKEFDKWLSESKLQIPSNLTWIIDKNGVRGSSFKT